MIHIEYHGYVTIAYWEYLLSLGYLLVLYMYFARVKSVKIKQNPEYGYLLWGLYAKVLGGVFFSLIYFYYYKGGDTTSYFYSAVSMSKLAKMDPAGYLTVLFGENNIENRSFFNMHTGYPFGYVYFDDRTFFVIRCISPLVILCLDSYLITTVVLSSLSYIGIWSAYSTFVSYFPQLKGQLAAAFLFMPSCIFWGSAILKDTFTLSALCLLIYALDQLFYKKRKFGMNIFNLILSSLILISVKPYIFMVIFPISMIWISYFRIINIRNTLVRFVVLPAVVVGLAAASVFTLQRMESQMGKFSLDNAISTIEVSQADLTRSEQYGENYFDIGKFDGTWSGLMSKLPVATTAGLFRPYLWEANSFVMALGGMENLWLLLLALGTLFKAGPRFLVRCISAIPILLMAFLFAIMFAFLIGVTTPNFGALVRFKIPLVPLFVAALFIVRYLRSISKQVKNSGRVFRIAEFRMGTAHLPDVSNRKR